MSFSNPFILSSSLALIFSLTACDPASHDHSTPSTAGDAHGSHVPSTQDAAADHEPRAAEAPSVVAVEAAPALPVDTESALATSPSEPAPSKRPTARKRRAKPDAELPASEPEPASPNAPPGKPKPDEHGGHDGDHGGHHHH
ncbi:MAG TPA: hypothetical protein VK034_14085 [Enhygromyxa sp.]|nr:hypothetical protein [Enhygromyxa sp.]